MIFSKLNYNEIFESLKSFKLFDPDGSGDISYKEICLVLKDLG